MASEREFSIKQGRIVGTEKLYRYEIIGSIVAVIGPGVIFYSVR